MSENNEINQIIRQAKSEVRSENAQIFFAKNAKLFFSIGVLILVSGIGFFAFNLHQKSQEKKFSAFLQESIMEQQAGNINQAKINLKKIIDVTSSPKNIKALAMLRYAALLLDEDKQSEAITLFQEVNQCNRCDAYIKDLAGLLTVKVWLADKEEVKKDDLLSRIEKIEANSKELKYQISEQKAWLEFQNNNLENA
jgi:hypothetical protein